MTTESRIEQTGDDALRKRIAPPWLAAPLAAVFGGVARLRRARGLHPRGVALGAVVEEADPRLGAPGDEAVVRLSRGAGLPSPLPDVLGVALRLPSAPGGAVDLLASTTTSLPLAYQLPLPTRRLDRALFTSITPYEVDGERALLVARVVGVERMTDLRERRGEVRVLFGTASTAARPVRPLVTVRLREELTGDDARALRFAPVEQAPSWCRPAGFVHALRPRAYAASRRGWPPEPE